VPPPGNQAANRENTHQPTISGETGLLDSINRGKTKVAIQALMVLFVMNVKRMVKLLLNRGQEAGVLKTG